MNIKQFFGIKKLLYASLFVGNIIMAAQYPVGGLFGINHDERFIQEPITKFLPNDYHNNGCCNEGIKFLKDALGNKFVMKYHSSKVIMVHDALGSKILGSADIPINKVWLLNKNSRLIKKFPPTRASLIIPSDKIATLHTYLPGDDLPAHIDIQDGIATEENLTSITANQDLCDIVAGNIYLNDIDSKYENNHFDQETNRYYTFDKGHIFGYAHQLGNNDKKLSPYNDDNLCYILSKNLLATRAYDYLENVEKDGLSIEEIIALKRVNKKLEQLSTTYPAEKIYNEWMGMAKDVDYKYSPQKQECLQVMIEYNLHEVKRLRSLLTRLTE